MRQGWGGTRELATTTGARDATRLEPQVCFFCTFFFCSTNLLMITYRYTTNDDDEWMATNCEEHPILVMTNRWRMNGHHNRTTMWQGWEGMRELATTTGLKTCHVSSLRYVSFIVLFFCSTNLLMLTYRYTIMTTGMMNEQPPSATNTYERWESVGLNLRYGLHVVLFWCHDYSGGNWLNECRWVLFLSFYYWILLFLLSLLVLFTNNRRARNDKRQTDDKSIHMTEMDG